MGTEDEYALWLILGEQSGSKVAQEVGKGALEAALLDECAHLGIRVGRVVVGDGEDWGAVGEEEGWDVVGVAGKGGEAILPRGASDWQWWTSGGHGWST